MAIAMFRITACLSSNILPLPSMKYRKPTNAPIVVRKIAPDDSMSPSRYNERTSPIFVMTTVNSKVTAIAPPTTILMIAPFDPVAAKSGKAKMAER